MASLTPNDPSYTLYLHMSTELDDEIVNIYRKRAEEHLQQILTNPFPDSGFDIFVPEETMLKPCIVNKVDFKIKCEMKKNAQTHAQTPSAFYMYPRSSISKSNFRLANNTGIIDSGYRGNLIGMFDVIYSDTPVLCKKGIRLLQICTPNLKPFKVVIVQHDNELSTTSRADGGFGSTGTSYTYFETEH